MRSLAPTIRLDILAPRPANADLAKPRDTPTPLAPFRKSLRSKDFFSSDILSSHAGIPTGNAPATQAPSHSRFSVYSQVAVPSKVRRLAGLAERNGGRVSKWPGKAGARARESRSQSRLRHGSCGESARNAVPDPSTRQSFAGRCHLPASGATGPVSPGG